jgi:GT2 family glycosyltransferase
MKKTAIIIINWNGWKDTIECLESFAWPVTDAHFFILDNHSGDESIVRLREYLEKRKLPHGVCAAGELGRVSGPGSAEEGAGQVTLVLNPANHGFAGGNNIILRHLLDTGGFRYAWLLNNDTATDARSLPEMRAWLEEHPDLAFCGSVILDYYKQGTVQCCGVDHYKYLGVSKLYLKDRVWDEKTAAAVGLGDRGLRYQIGASLLVDLEKLKKIGLMDETFFIYSEEADWQFRAKSLGYGNGLAPKSIVVHKGSISTANRKHLFFYHYNRSAIILTRKNFGLLAAFTATISLIGVTAIRSRLAPKPFWFGLKGLVRGWRTPMKKRTADDYKKWTEKD